MVMAGSDSAAHYSGSSSLVAAAPGPNSKSQWPATGSSTHTGAAVLATASRLSPDMRLILVLLAAVSARVVRELPREGWYQGRCRQEKLATLPQMRPTTRPRA